MVVQKGTMRHELMGGEKFFARNPEECEKISQVLEVEGNISILVKHIQHAWQYVMNRHPKMRVLQLQNPQFSIVCHPTVSLEEASKSLSIVYSKDTNAWKSIIATDRPFDRYKDFPFRLCLCIQGEKNSSLDETGGTARLILFSDHYMSDGQSGMVIVNEILQFVTNPSSLSSMKPDTDDETQWEPSLYELCYPDHKTFKTIMLSSIVRNIVPSALYVLHSLYRPFLPPQVIQKSHMKPQMVHANSSKEALKKILVKCKEEKVTVGNFLLTAFTLAAAATKESVTQEQLNTIKSTMEVPYNMRQRFGAGRCVDKNTVGMYSTSGTLDFMSSQGIQTSISFWDTVRKFQKEMQLLSKDNSFMFLLPNMVAHECATSSMIKKQPDCTSDLRISILGRYPFQKEHFIQENKTQSQQYNNKIVVKNLFSTSWIKQSCAVAMFVSSVENLTLSCVHRLQNQVGEQLVQQLLYIIENVSEIHHTMTNRDVLDILRKNVKVSTSAISSFPPRSKL